MLVRGQVALTRERLHRLSLPDGLVAGDVVEHLRLEHEEAAVDPGAVALRLFLKGGDLRLVLADRDRAEASRRLHRGERCQHVLRAVEGEQRRYVQRGEAVAV